MKFVIDGKFPCFIQMFEMNLGWHLRYPDDPRFEPSAYLDKLVAEGRLGRKSGEGFFKYNWAVNRSHDDLDIEAISLNSTVIVSKHI